MARSARLRTRKKVQVAGWRRSSFTGDTSVPVIPNDPSLDWSCQDLKGFPVADGNLDMRLLRHFGLSGVSGTNYDVGQGGFVEARNALPGRLTGDLVEYATGQGIPSQQLGDLSTKTIARTNPNRPEIIPGNLIQDLVTIPSMLREIGSNLKHGGRLGLSKVFANSYLASKFGWAPLFDDIKSLTEVGSKVARRHSELLRLMSDGGLKRRVRLGEVSAVTESQQFIDSGFPFYLEARVSNITKEKTYGIARWVPDNSFRSRWRQLSDEERFALARRLVLGATASGTFASSWDLIPWTWLVGWFSNVRDYILAHGNTVPATLAKPPLAVLHLDQTRSFSRISVGSGLQMSSGDVVWERYTRYVLPYPAINVHLPYLSADRLSTLAALAVQRLR